MLDRIERKKKKKKKKQHSRENNNNNNNTQPIMSINWLIWLIHNQICQSGVKK